jgi:cellulose synthase/poly-beta-1,6-N-acetylglucosamine synthase-like glycosyltransferase
MSLFLNAFVVGSLILSVLLPTPSAYTLYLMLYTWDRPEAHQRAKAPAQFLPAHKSFTVMLPARHEEEVIQTTIERVVRANYPNHLLEVVVICKTDDAGTIGKAEEKIARLHDEGITNVRVLTFSNPPTEQAARSERRSTGDPHEVVTIFDSEDDIHPDIFNVINTVMLQESVNVVSGVQLMNYESNWYSTLNVLEFSSGSEPTSTHAQRGMTPLGGNTVFSPGVLVAAGAGTVI